MVNEPDTLGLRPMPSSDLSKRNIDALLFDIGRVILDIDATKIARHWLGTFEKYGIERDARSDEEIAVLITQSETYYSYECGEISEDAFFRFVADTLGIPAPGSGEVISALRDGWNAIFTGEMPNVREMITNASEIAPIYAFSNTNQTHSAFFLPKYPEIFSKFTKLYLSQEIGMRKPHISSFSTVVADMGVPADRVIFFDDLPENVEGARAAGLQAVWVNGPDAAPNYIKALSQS